MSALDLALVSLNLKPNFNSQFEFGKRTLHSKTDKRLDYQLFCGKVTSTSC